MAAPSDTRLSESPDQLIDPATVVEPRRSRRWRRGWNRRRLASMGAVLVLVVAAVLTTWAVTRKNTSSAATPLAVTTEKVTVSTGTIKESVAASGTVEPGSQADLSFGVSGQVNAVDVSVGQKVSAGQTLATIGTTALQDDVNAASESLSADQARLSTDESDSASTSQIDSDQAAVTSAESQLATAKQNLADADLTSSIAGTVASVGLGVGQEVGSSSSGDTGSGASGSSSTGLDTTSDATSSSSSDDIVVVSTTSYQVDASVDDTQVGQIKVGDQVTIDPSGSTDTIYGTVSSVGLVASSDSSGTSSVASFPVVVAVTGTPSGLYPGTSATLTIITEQLDNVVEVPTSAISYSNGQATVTEVVGSSQKAVPVTTGAAASGETQITGGLKAGAVIIERVVKFNATSGGGRSLFGGTGTRTGSFGGGGFPSGGGFTGGGGGGFAGFNGSGG